MRLLILSHEYHPVASGGASLLLELCPHLVRRGVEVVILTPRLPGTPPVESPAPGITVVRRHCGRRSLGNAALWELAAFGGLAIPWSRGLIRSLRPDALLSLFLVPAGFSGAVAGRLAGLPHLVFVGGADLPQVDSAFGQLLGRITPLLRWILRSAAGVLVAEGLEGEVLRLAPGLPLVSVRNGADVAAITPHPPSWDGRRPLRLLTIGRLIPRKGAHQLVEALALLPPEQRTRFHLTVVGYGPLQETMERTIAEAGLSGQVTLAGRVAKADLPEFYRQADLYLFYSTPEGTSLAMVEAMAHGLPVVTSDVPGNRELCDGNGLRVPLGGAQPLARALAQLLTTPPATLTPWSQRSRDIALEYDWSAIAPHYLALLERAVGRPPP